VLWIPIFSRYTKILPPKNAPIYGTYNLPKGYQLAYVPGYADVQPLDSNSVKKVVKLDRNVTGIIIAIFQTLYALSTLYRGSIEQVAIYGYASFGLTVAPYATMSIVNLLASLICPGHQMLYLIETSVMQEARSRPGAVFNEVVGKVEDDDKIELLVTERGATRTYVHRGTLTTELSNGSSSHFILRGGDEDKGSTVSENEIAGSQPVKEKSSHDIKIPDARALIPGCLPPKSTRKTSHNRRFCLKDGSYEGCKEILLERTPWISKAVYYLLIAIMTVIPVAIVGAISHFRPASSTTRERVWLMSWLCSGLCFSWITTPLNKLVGMNDRLDNFYISLYIIVIVGCFIPAVGGFVVVGQMLSSYGSCTRTY